MNKDEYITIYRITILALLQLKYSVVETKFLKIRINSETKVIIYDILLLLQYQVSTTVMDLIVVFCIAFCSYLCLRCCVSDSALLTIVRVYKLYLLTNYISVSLSNFR